MPKLSLTIRGAICLLLIFLPLYRLDKWFYDQYFRLRGTLHKPTDFVLIQVSDSKLYSLMAKNKISVSKEKLLFQQRTHSVWYQSFYESILPKIEAGSPKLVVFTSYFNWFDQQNKPGFDQTNVLFSSAINKQKQLIPPKSSLTSGSNYGYSNIFPDPDNVVRQSYLRQASATSLTLRIYHRLNERPIKRNLHEPLKIDFRGPAGSYPHIDAWKIMEGKVQPDLFKNKIILIGKSQSPSSEFATPFGRMSATEIHANATETFLQDREIQMMPQWVIWILATLAVVASITIILVFPLTLAWLILLLLSLVFILVTLFVFAQFKVWWGIGNPIFCIFGTHLIMLGYKLSRQEEQQWKIQQEANSLKEIDQFKNNFISLFSHDLKTPISKIKAITERLLSSKPDMDTEIRESLGTIEKTNTELSRLISDILKVTKMETMSLELKKEVIDLNCLVEVAVKRLNFLAEEKGIEIVMDFEPLFSMDGDNELIQEVITNLLENALKYSLPKTKVVISTAEEEDFVRVSIKDEGEGISADEIPRVVGKFYRGRDTIDQTKGSGLGLYLAKYFVELHKGKLDITSEVGKGTTVSFTLPLSQ